MKTGKVSWLGQKFNSLKFNFQLFCRLILHSKTCLSNIRNGFRLLPKETSERKTMSLVNSVLRNTSVTDQCVYRTELRCKFSDVDSIVSTMTRYTVCKNFNYFEYSEFYNIFQKNIDNFIGLITNRCLYHLKPSSRQ